MFLFYTVCSLGWVSWHHCTTLSMFSSLVWSGCRFYCCVIKLIYYFLYCVRWFNIAMIWRVPWSSASQYPEEPCWESATCPCLFVFFTSVIISPYPLRISCTIRMCPIGSDLRTKTITLRLQVVDHLCEGSIVSEVISAYLILHHTEHHCGCHDSDTWFQYKRLFRLSELFPCCN